MTTTPRRRLLICTAVSLETQQLARALRIAPLRGDETILPEADCSLLQVGIGATSLAVFLQQHHEHFDGVVMAGLAGGLDPKIALGTVCIDSASVPLPAGPWPVVRVQRVDQVVTSPSAKQTLRTQTGADLVDMENARVLELARRFDLPCVAVRAVSDTACDSIPAVGVRLLKPDGNISLLAVLLYVVIQPWNIPPLLRMGEKSKLAAQKLAEAVVTLVHSSWPDMSAQFATVQ